MLKKLLPIFCLAFLMFMPDHTQAQTDFGDVLIIRSDGDFWSWSEVIGLTRLTVEGFPYDVERSADGRYLVYATRDDVVFEAIERGEEYAVDVYPTNLWRYDLQTGEAVEIAAQPAEMVYSSEAVVGYDRFNPQWSPDGSKIAWIELPLGMPNEDAWRLVIFDVAQGSAKSVTDLPAPSGIGDGSLMAAIGLRWASVGLITETVFMSDDRSVVQNFVIYDEAGAVIAEHDLSSVSISGWFWSDDEAAMFGMARNDENKTVGVLRLDLFAGTEEIRPGSLIVTVSRRAPDQLAYHLVDNDETHVAHWWMWQADTPTVYEVTSERYLSSQFAIDPDGQRIAYITDALYIWQDGQAQRIADTEQFATARPPANLIWGATTGVLTNWDELPFVVE
ncbi:MAG: hypothetical protein K8L91_31570 [Anaerolineae bacterium]|nr:hypothetical protein [Anaerolineae bacterium]